MVFQQNLLRLTDTKNNLHHCEGKKRTNNSKSSFKTKYSVNFIYHDPRTIQKNPQKYLKLATFPRTGNWTKKVLPIMPFWSFMV